MAVITPVETYTDILLSDLLVNVMEKKHAGMRLVQICCAVIGEQYELLYSFADDANYSLTHLRVMTGLNEKIPSITTIYPYANFYENEMAELFGVPVELIRGDYHGKFYRINQEMPFLTEKEKALKKAGQEAEKHG